MTGLAYEILWVRLLTLGFGSTTLSFSTVLAVFFGGLAIGSKIGGAWAPQFLHPGRLYAMIEIIIGCISISLYPILKHIDNVFTIIDPSQGWTGAGVRIIISAPLLLIPTILMGATIPIVTRAVVVQDHSIGTGTATIYGLNTLGAFLGTYLITYYGLYYLGTFRCILCSAAINILAGVIAWCLSTPITELSSYPRTIESHPVMEKERNIAVALAFLVGFAAICFQLVWVRLYSIFLDGTIYGVGSVLISTLMGIGVGSLWIARPLRFSTHPHLWFYGLQAIVLGMFYIFSHTLPWIAYTLRSIPESLQGLTAVHVQLLVVVLSLSIFSIASGASMPLLVATCEHQAKEAGNTMGKLFAANTLGSIAASLLAGFLFIPTAGTVVTLYIGMLSLSLTACLSVVFFGQKTFLSRVILTTLPLGLLALWPGLDPLHLSLMGSKTAAGKSYAGFMKSINHQAQSVVKFDEGASASVVVAEDASGTRSLWLNGLGQGARLAHPPFHVYESLMVALVPLAHVVAPERVFVVGLGAGVSIDALLQLQTKHIEVAEIEPAVIRAQRTIFPEHQSPLDDPRVTVHPGDARLLLRTAQNHERGPYDIITSMPAHPWVAANIFTEEFFTIAKDNLSKNGVFSTWFGLGRVDQISLDSLIRAFTNVFDNYIVYHLHEAQALYLVGSNRSLHVDIDRFAALRQHPAVRNQTSLQSDFHLAYQVIGSGQPGDPKPEPGPINNDDSALVEVRTPRMSAAAHSLNHLLPYPYLQAELLAPKNQRSSLATTILEHLLGTPNGVIPATSQPMRHLIAAQSFTAWRSILPQDTQRYFQGRQALHRGNLDQAKQFFANLSGPLQSRAQQFLFTSQPTTLPPISGDTILHSNTLAAILDTASAAYVGEHLPLSPPDAHEDPWGWLIWHGLSKTASVTPPVREAFIHVAAKLQHTRYTGLLDLARSIAVQQQWQPEAQILNSHLLHKRQSRAQNLLRMSGQSSEIPQDKRLEFLEQAAKLDPTSQPILKRLLLALIEAEADTLRVEPVLRALKLQGWTSEQLHFFTNHFGGSSFSAEPAP